MSLPVRALLAVALLHSVAFASNSPSDVTARMRQWLRTITSPTTARELPGGTGRETSGEEIDDLARGRHAPPDTFAPRAEDEWIARTIPARWGHQLLFDASRNRVIVVGGDRGGAIWGDAWAIDLDAPVRAERVTASAYDRFGPGIAAVIDPRTDRLIVHGGERYAVIDGPPGDYIGDQGGPLAAPLSGDGRWSWLDRPYGSVTGPGGRHGHVAVLDESRHRVVVFGGLDYHEIYGVLGLVEPRRDAWTWSLEEPQHWDSIAVDGDAPTETVGDGAAWDPALDVVWYVARGGVWKLDLASARWDSIPAAGAFAALHQPIPVTQVYVPTTPGPDAFVAFDATGRRLYRYVPSLGVQSLNVDAPAAWTTLAVGGAPGATFGPIAWDSRARRLLRFSGADAPTDHWHRNRVEGPVLWGLSVDHPERGWEVLYDARVPQLGIVAGVYDARRDRILAINRVQPLAGLYELRGDQTRWAELPVVPDLLQGLGSLVLDPVRDRLLLDVASFDFGSQVATYSYDLSAQDGWQYVAESGLQSTSDLAWDADQQRVIRIRWTDEWVTRVEALVSTPAGENWRNIPIEGTLQPRIRTAGLVANDERGRVFVTGGFFPDLVDDENLWILEAGETARWTRQRHDAYFSTSDWPAATWDPLRKRLMVHGSYGGCCGWRMDGLGITDRGATNVFAFPGTIWEWWTPRRYGGGLVYDSAHDTFLIFGGYGPERVTGSQAPASGDPTDPEPLADVHAIAFARPPRTIRVDARPGAGNDRVRPGTHQTLQVAALSDAGFDARTIDLATVYVAGVPVRRDGGGRPTFNVRDVDGDARDDVVLQFDAHDLPITEAIPQVKLWGRTFDDSRVEGLATVDVKTRAVERNATSSLAGGIQAPAFTVRIAGTAASMHFACMVAGYPGARIEAFDIAGRRVASGVAPAHAGASVLDLTPEAPLTRGIYLVRLTGPATLSRKVLALP